MFDFGDEFIIGSQKIPWLIWIQLLVMLLLIILLYYFTIFAFGLDPSPTAATAPPPTSSLLAFNSQSSRHGRPTAAATSSSRLHSTKVGETQRIKSGDMGTSTSSSRRVRREEIQEREGSSLAKDATPHTSVLEGGSYHPCHYFGLAKQAFLKCLGLDPTSKDSYNARKRKEQ